MRFNSLTSAGRIRHTRRILDALSHNSGTNVRKMTYMYINPNLDIVNMNAYMKFCQIMSICSQNIERK